MIDVSCPQCGAVYHADWVHLGKRIRCSRCGSVVLIIESARAVVHSQYPRDVVGPSPSAKFTGRPKWRMVGWAIGAVCALAIGIFSWYDRLELGDTGKIVRPTDTATAALKKSGEFDVHDLDNLASEVSAPKPPHLAQAGKQEQHPKIYQSLPTGTPFCDADETRGKGALEIDQAAIFEDYGKLPLSFEKNQGQTDARVKFLSRGNGYTLFLTEDEAVFELRCNKGEAEGSVLGPRSNTRSAVSTTTAVLRMKLRNANSGAKVAGVGELPGKGNYFIGREPKKWQTNIPTYERVKYEGVYAGIDLIYYGNQQQLEYDFVVNPGADPRRIQFDIWGAETLNRQENGDLLLRTAVGDIRWRKPMVYQERAGSRQEIAARYVIKDTGRVGFEVAHYDPLRPLFIDPLVYSTYLGGNTSDIGLGVTVDSIGNAYVTGFTDSINFPTTSGAFQVECGGGCGNGDDVFVTKLNATGSALAYSTFLGGSASEVGQGITVDALGNAYVTGYSTSTDFPMMSPLQGAYAGGNGDAFVTKLSPDGSALIYSTYLGGSSQDLGNGIALDGSGNVYITGYSSSMDFPTMNPLQAAYAGGNGDAFVAKLNPTASTLIYSTYLGGSNYDYGIAVDPSGDAYVAGFTGSTDFPTVVPLQQVYGGGTYDAFIAKLNPTGSGLIYSTYLGGSGSDASFGIAVDGSGHAYVTGYSASTDLPIKNALQATSAGAVDAFIAELNPDGSTLVYSTYLGGSGSDAANGIAVDGSGNAYIVGNTASANFPIMDPFQSYGGDLRTCS